MPRTLPATFVALLMILAACGGTGTAQRASEAPPSSAPAIPSGSAGSTDLVVGTDPGTDLKFDPAVIAAPAGGTVLLTFENRATVPHNLTFDEPINAATSTVVSPGASEVLEFTAPSSGSYAFVCTLHPGMSGSLTVD